MYKSVSHSHFLNQLFIYTFALVLYEWYSEPLSKELTVNGPITYYFKSYEL